MNNRSTFAFINVELINNQLIESELVEQTSNPHARPAWFSEPPRTTRKKALKTASYNGPVLFANPNPSFELPDNNQEFIFLVEDCRNLKCRVTRACDRMNKLFHELFGKLNQPVSISAAYEPVPKDGVAYRKILVCDLPEDLQVLPIDKKYQLLRDLLKYNLRPEQKKQILAEIALIRQPSVVGTDITDISIKTKVELARVALEEQLYGLLPSGSSNLLLAEALFRDINFKLPHPKSLSTLILLTLSIDEPKRLSLLQQKLNAIFNFLNAQCEDKHYTLNLVARETFQGHFEISNFPDCVINLSPEQKFDLLSQLVNFAGECRYDPEKIKAILTSFERQLQLQPMDTNAALVNTSSFFQPIPPSITESPSEYFQKHYEYNVNTTFSFTS